MQTIRRRFLQIGVIALALTMLSIYVVRSQSRQGAAAKPTSRSWQPANPRKQAIISPGSKSAAVVEPRSAPAPHQSNATNLLDRPLTKAEEEMLNDTNWVLVGRTMMPGSKSGKVALVFSNKAAMLADNAAAASKTAPSPGTNAAKQMMMTGSKSAPVFSLIGSISTNQVSATNPAARPMMPGSKSAGVFPGSSPASKTLPELPLKSPKTLK
jgi:hypothetical protein